MRERRRAPNSDRLNLGQWTRERRYREAAAAVHGAEPEKIRQALTVLVAFLVRAGDAATDRHRAVTSLAGVLRFLEAFPEIGLLDLDTPLRALLRGLLSLDHGAVEPMLEPRPTRGRPVQVTWLLFRAHAAAAAELAKRAGCTLPDACDFVAERLDRAGYRLPGRGDHSTITGSTVRAWRREVLTSRTETSAAARAAYNAFLGSDTADEFGPLRLSEEILAGLPGIFPIHTRPDNL
jgi:hypothetical protein